jgi:hypothetical protein
MASKYQTNLLNKKFKSHLKASRELTKPLMRRFQCFNNGFFPTDASITISQHNGITLLTNVLNPPRGGRRITAPRMVAWAAPV